MTSQLKVDRISPATGSEIIIEGDEKYFHVYKKSDQSVEDGVSTKVVLDTVHSDPYGTWSSSNNEYTIPSDGLYMVHSNLGGHDRGVSKGLASVIVEIYLNGSLETQGRNSNNFGSVDHLVTNTLTRVLPLSAGDKISWYARFTCKSPETPSALFVSGTGYHNSFAWIYKVASS